MIKRGLLENKKAQGLSLNAIILIVLGVVVLVLLIMGFTMGWESLAPWMSSNNVDETVQQCSVACSTQSSFDFCSQERELNDGENKIKTTCYKLATNESFANKYGISPCPGIECPPQ